MDSARRVGADTQLAKTDIPPGPPADRTRFDAKGMRRNGQGKRGIELPSLCEDKMLLAPRLAGVRLRPQHSQPLSTPGQCLKRRAQMNERHTQTILAPPSQATGQHGWRHRRWHLALGHRLQRQQDIAGARQAGSQLGIAV